MAERRDPTDVPDPRYDTVLPRSLRLRLALPFVVLTGVVLLVLSVVLSDRAREIHVDRLTDEIEIEARMIADLYLLAEQQGAEIDFGTVVENLPGESERRITLIGQDGTVLADTGVADVAALENHAGREEVREALATGSGVAMRASDSLGDRFLYVGVVLGDGSDTVLRIAVPLDDVDDVVDGIRRSLLLATGVALTLAAVMAVVIGARLAAPLEALRLHAQRVAEGDLTAAVPPSPTKEIDAVGDAFNAMTARLRESLNDLERTRTRLEAVLSGFGDGVVITDAEGYVLRMNQAAESMLAIREDRAVGRPFIQVARDHELDRLLRAALDGRAQRPEAIEHGLNRRTLLSSVSRVEGRSEYLGLAVLRDITDLRRLEGVRRDFVANVSHELRTPLTSIRAIAETIEAGAVDDPALMSQMLRRVIGEVDRLTALVEDLLDLARLEAGRAAMTLEPIDTAGLVRDAGERLRAQTEQADLELRFDVAEDMPRVVVDRRSIEQVILNLVHNAIKFTPAGGSITLSARARGDRVEIAVSDTGIGIEEDELSRLFERFYKSDRARRSEGTGLGLAIAKHTVQAHGGEITVESRPGSGSIFSFTLLTAGSVDAELLIARVTASGHGASGVSTRSAS